MPPSLYSSVDNWGLSLILRRGLLLVHKNAMPHTMSATQETIWELKWKLVDHPPYSPNVATNDL